jgi:hypothetical protein
MAIVKNPDGTITVGIIPADEPKPVKAEAPAEAKPKKTAAKKTAKKKD